MPSRRRTAIVALLVALTLITASCGLTKKERAAARDVAAKFAEAMTARDYAHAASYTTDPDKAAADLTFVTEQLSKPETAYTLDEVTASTAEGTVKYQVALKVLGRELAYKVTAQLVTDKNNDWKIDWKPSVIHPQLTGDTHLQVVQAPGTKPVILDRNGQPLMSEQLVTVVRVDPRKVTDPAGTAQALSGALSPIDASFTPDAIAGQISSASETFTLVALRPEAAASVSVPALPGITSNKQARLLTAAKGLRSVALSGLQSTWDSAAKASTGWSLQLQDAKNDNRATLLDVPAAPVSTIPTTFDATLQAAAQAAVDKVPGQAVLVAVQPSTGGVLSVAQNAAADVEGPVALTGQYAPGSTFKIVSTAAALAAGAAQPDTQLDCPGKATIKGRTIPNDEEFDLGTVPLHTAFAHSCNTTIAALAAELPANALHDQALGFGLGVDYVAPGLTTITGKAPVATSDAEMVEDSIGQGKVVASPFAMALMAATVAHGSTPLPTLVTGQPTTADQSPPAPSPQVITALRAMMAETVASGTAKSVNDISGLAGKTGTAQFGDGSHSHGWFVGYYKDLAFAVLLVGADSSKPAVAVAGDFIRAAKGQIPT
ncbi:penicillin-binding transpeptidase domain-containing protein [Cumulibacter manganitolerans]|uniref:penicillin-binding transpeptidase domain-containing protein n=1 Tax=Cumulibacter manganitolerans TaxID=1884992 RepID=UPI001E4ED9E6|nr:penicillin-binding transpeptidase domain-containing protein [Cumulibacter manganitolerans]